jgi:hypothetical protein
MADFLETLLSLVFAKSERKPYATSPPIETDSLKVACISVDFFVFTSRKMQRSDLELLRS